MLDRDTVVKMHCLQSTNEAAKAILQEWANKQGHERCHWHPEILQKLADLFGVEPTVEPMLPPEAEFEEMCGKYRQEQYHGKGT
jgi:hypothetical protein